MTSDHPAIHKQSDTNKFRGSAVAEDVVFHHPFLNAPVRGRDQFKRFWEEFAELTGPVSATQEFNGEDGAGLVWSSRFANQPIQGVTISALRDQQIVELRVLVRPLPFVQRLRDTMREHDPQRTALWELPANAVSTAPPFDPTRPVDAQLPFQVAPNVVFHSPVLRRPVVGEDLVKRIIGHASSIYGGRTYGSRMILGSQALTQWAGTVGGLPIHAVNHSTRDEQGRVTAITMFMGPVPTLELFFRQLRPRVESFLGGEYFEH